jgi:hypothetical protein
MFGDWSGARKYFESKYYTADDIKQGYFHGMSVASPSTINVLPPQPPGAGR